MSQTVLDSPVVVAREISSTRSTLVRLAALTPAVLLIHGYHPFADDAGIYVAGIRKLLHPALYRPDAAFVLANTHLSLFAHAMAAAVRVTHLSLTAALLVAHLLSIYLFLLACWSLAARLFERTAERWFATGFAAACFTLPAAGTALVLMDPYVTARSFSTPLGLFAIAAAMNRKWWLAALLALLAGTMHPQMFFYAAALAFLYAVIDAGGMRRAIFVGVAGIAAAGLIAFITRHEPISAAYYEALQGQQRSYWYLRQWKWYEDLGLIAPLVLYAIAAFRSQAGSRIRKVCQACLVLGTSCVAVSLLFVHPSGPYLLVRFEVLRGFHTLYAVGTILLGGGIAKAFFYRRRTRWLPAGLLLLASGGLFAAQRAAYPGSAHIEWPGMQPRNPWAQAYWWVRANTPADAVFAADPNLTFNDGVDMQNFRATTARSLLADNKDQGVAAGVYPSIAGVWASQRDAQLGLNQMSDAQRVKQLAPFGVNWLLLEASAPTSFPCPYQNAVAKVCRMD